MTNNRTYHKMIVQMGEAAGRIVGLLNDQGDIVACSNLTLIGESRSALLPMLAVEEDAAVINGFTYSSFGEEHREYVLFAEGEDEEAARIVRMMSISFSCVRSLSDDRQDRNLFIKNVVMENVLPGDIYVKAREMHFAMDVQRVVLLVRIAASAVVPVADIVASLFPNKQRDFVFTISETDIVIVKEVDPEIDEKDLEKLAGSIIDTLEGEHYVNCIAGIGTVVSTINELAASFKEARFALEVGKVFDTEHAIVSYNNLGIARLIYQLPTTLCEMFLREVFKKGSIESLDRETLFTIQRFFENNLNVSETSRGLFVHRNTLVYRLEKIKKLTGLDLRQFDHAIIFKVALMVKKYLDVNPEKN